jgi:hypothetical protein
LQLIDRQAVFIDEGGFCYLLTDRGVAELKQAVFSFVAVFQIPLIVPCNKSLYKDMGK